MGSGTFIVDTDYVLGLSSSVNGARGALGQKQKAKNGTTEAIAQVPGLGIVLDCATKFDDSLTNLDGDLEGFSGIIEKFAGDMTEKDEINVENFETIEGYMEKYNDGEHVSVEDNFATAESSAFQVKMDDELNAYNANQEKQVTADNKQEIPIAQPEDNSVIEKEDLFDMGNVEVTVNDVDDEIDVDREKLFEMLKNSVDVEHDEDSTVIDDEDLYQQDTTVYDVQTHDFDSQTESKNMGNPYATGEYQTYDYEKNQGEGKEKIEYLYDFDNKQYVVNHYSEDGNTLIRKVVIDPVSGNVINETSFDEINKA
jgi:hypothetical protein